MQSGFGNSNVQLHSNANPDPDVLRHLKGVTSTSFGDVSFLHDLFGMKSTHTGPPVSMRRSLDMAEDCVDEQVR